MGLRVAFAGTPAFAAEALGAIADAGFTIPLVLSRPDKPKGRGLVVEASEVAREASRRNLPLAKPRSLRSPDPAFDPTGTPVDVLVVAAYGLILPRRVLEWPRHGCLNIHASLLPRWRGAAPIERAIEAGDPQTGISIMQMDEGLDTGPVVTADPIAIDGRETAGSLRAKLAGLGSAAIVGVLRTLEREGSLASTPQPPEGATYADKVTSRDARIAWADDACAIDRKVRAFAPAPGAFTALEGALIKVWRAEPIDAAPEAAAGSILSIDEALVVACGRGALRVLELQPAGGKRMAARAFATGRSLNRASRFVSPEGSSVAGRTPATIVAARRVRSHSH